MSIYRWGPMDDLTVERIECFVVESKKYEYKEIFTSLEQAAYNVAAVMFYSKWHPQKKYTRAGYVVKTISRLARFVLPHLKEQLDL